MDGNLFGGNADVINGLTVSIGILRQEHQTIFPWIQRLRWGDLDPVAALNIRFFNLNFVNLALAMTTKGVRAEFDCYSRLDSRLHADQCHLRTHQIAMLVRQPYIERRLSIL